MVELERVGHIVAVQSVASMKAIGVAERQRVHNVTGHTSCIQRLWCFG